MRRTIGVVAIALLVASACGGDRGMSDAAERSLRAKVADVRTAAEARRADEAEVKLAELRAEVQALQDQGELSAERASTILASAAKVNQQLSLITTTTSPPPPKDPDRGKDDDKDGEKKEEEKKDDD